MTDPGTARGPLRPSFRPKSGGARRAGVLAGLLLVLLAPAASGLAVLDEDEDAVVVVVPDSAPRTYGLVAELDAPEPRDSSVTVRWEGPGAEADTWRIAGERVLTLDAGPHRFEVTRAPASGWLLLVPEDASEPGAAAPFPPRDGGQSWVLAIGAVAAAAGATGAGLIAYRIRGSGD